MTQKEEKISPFGWAFIICLVLTFAAAIIFRKHRYGLYIAGSFGIIAIITGMLCRYKK